MQIRKKDIDATHIYNGDYDFFIPENQLPRCLETIFDVLSEKNISFSIDRRKYGKTTIFIYNPQDARKTIQMELWIHLDVKDPYKKTSKYIHEDKLNPLIFLTQEAYRLPIDFESLYYLSHLFSKSKSLESEEVNDRIRHYQASTRHYKAIAKLYNGLVSSGDIKKAAHDANMLLVQSNHLDIKSWAGKRTTRIKITKEALKSRLKLMKLFKLVPVLGPDGVGKTTLINSLSSESTHRVTYYRFKKLFRKSLLYKLFYRSLKKHVARVYLRDCAKNEVDDYFGGLVVLFALTHFPLLSIRALLGRSLIFSDRFFQDFILQFVRSQDRRTRLRPKWAFFLSLIPRSYFFLQLDAPPAVIHSRKEEMRGDNILLYRDLIFRQYMHKPAAFYTYINTKNDVAHCRAIIEKNLKSMGL